MAPTEQQAKQSKLLQLAGKKKIKANVARYLKTTEPQLVEPTKSTLLLQGIRASANMMTLLKELKAVQAPHSKLLSKKNPIVAFEDPHSLEFLLTKNDCALFAMATHNKKRPNNLIMGRTFNHQVLDMVELGVTYFKSMQDFGGTIPKKRIGSKPLLLFVGDIWQQELDFRNLQNLLTDFYRGDIVDKLVAAGLDHLMVFTAARDPNVATHPVRIHQRTYFVKQQSSNDGQPPAMTSCGPDLDFFVRRTQWADTELANAARKQPAKPKKRKNRTTNMFGEHVGRLHLTHQTFENTGRKSKALRRADQASKRAEREAIESELAQEKKQMEHEASDI